MNTENEMAIAQAPTQPTDQPNDGAVGTAIPDPASARPAIRVEVTPEASEKVATDEVRIAVKDLSIYYGQKRAVREVTMDVPANAVTAFIGPSGCGKSTILRCFDRMNDLIPGARIEGQVVLNG